MTPPATKPKTSLNAPLYERILAAACYVSGFFAPFLAPLIVWLITRWFLRFTAQHALKALVNHLLGLLAIGIFAGLAIIVFLLGLGGTFTVPPASGTTQTIYFILFLAFVASAILVWLGSQIEYVIGAIQALRGKPAHGIWPRRHKDIAPALAGAESSKNKQLKSKQ
jgi:uncharacterized Tic20 family protein